ncbi:MAG TPA: rhodanese-like domain-containing protein, partial [Anaerolineales bacterium]|nr:rhodanese-like domain-containing protein [Anaerolineales bacterium]
DVRHQKQFGAGHIPNSYGIRVEAPLTTWAGWVIPFGSRIILVAESADQRSEAMRQLIRIGYDELVGYLDGGIEAWAREYPVETVQTINVQDLRERLNEVGPDGRPPLQLVDVRQTSEWNAGHIPGAIHFEGGRIANEEIPFTQDKPLVIQCASGNRSMVAISVLKRRGFRNLIQVEGGINQWKKNGFEITKDNQK